MLPPALAGLSAARGHGWREREGGGEKEKEKEINQKMNQEM